jgi:hypothetical protein
MNKCIADVIETVRADRLAFWQGSDLLYSYHYLEQYEKLTPENYLESELIRPRDSVSYWKYANEQVRSRHRGGGPGP